MVLSACSSSLAGKQRGVQDRHRTRSVGVVTGELITTSSFYYTFPPRNTCAGSEESVLWDETVGGEGGTVRPPADTGFGGAAARAWGSLGGGPAKGFAAGEGGAKVAGV